MKSLKIAIVAALTKEISYYLDEITDLEASQQAGVKIWRGHYQGHELAIAQCGIGKVNAALATTLLAMDGPDLIINNGSAGAVDKDLAVGDLVLAQEAAYHDVDMTAFDQIYGQIEGLPARFQADSNYLSRFEQCLADQGETVNRGLVVSGDSFVASPAKVEEIAQNLPGALCTEMEGAAIAHVAYQFQLPFLIARAMSDTAEQDAAIDFDQFISEVGPKSARLTLNFIGQYLKD
ncbi:hypothetical protein HMPREF2626_04000 [Aerococcus sp. HMSC062A02]|nr:5'-methylthioadenosine/adenosylhomocysteine nucleosidase [Aerococcus sanguinicola]OFN04787.1 hypothetical protein HMPREF2626_04000 [Aerococcus sp. HMSC062A02]OHO44679.1 hypothetical protein HMPREF2705_01190 [Aerococcus sp. HMSC035B07]